ncbi:MAG: phosphocholine cytidylyltransferase family protein [Anaeroplasmataceae bacterium]|nr:phosphocholine cytidylyltransferase family protein [Anaeroplasmataceae bacterium]
MKALILAAGLGSRLAPITDHCPKSMVPVNGKPILFKQIENLHENGITDITIISGYKAEVLEEAVSSNFSGIQFIRSVDYANTNNMYSAYLAKDILKGEAFLMMNADVFYDASVIQELLACPYENAIVVEIGKYIEESMKVTESNGVLSHISKQISPEEALGVSIDVYKFSPSAGEVFFKKCREYIEDKTELKLWSEVALHDVLGEVNFKACPLKGRWLEIDNHDDLAAAENLFRE